MSFRECNHVKSDGLKCKSPALNRHSYCYFHHRWNKRQQRRIQLGGPVGTNNNTGIEMPILESYEEIQIGIMEVLQAIIDDRVSGKRAGLMLYALQLASTNTRLMQKPGISQPGGVLELSEPELDSSDPLQQRSPSEQSAEASPDPNRKCVSIKQPAETTPNPPREGSPARGCGEPGADGDPSRTTARRQFTDPCPAEHITSPAGTSLTTDSSKSASTEPSLTEASPENSAPSAPQRRRPTPAELAELCQRYPGVSDENLIRFLPQPNDNDTRLYFNPDDSIYQRQKIKERRILSGIYL